MPRTPGNWQTAVAEGTAHQAADSESRYASANMAPAYRVVSANTTLWAPTPGVDVVVRAGQACKALLEVHLPENDEDRGQGGTNPKPCAVLFCFGFPCSSRCACGGMTTAERTCPPSKLCW